MSEWIVGNMVSERIGVCIYVHARRNIVGLCTRQLVIMSYVTGKRKLYFNNAYITVADVCTCVSVCVL